jgi:hypothetical protein
LPFDSVESGRALEQILSVIQVKHRILPPGIFRVVVSRRQPYPQKSCVIKNSAAEFVQAQISRRRLRADYLARRSGAITPSWLDRSHSEKEFYQNTTEDTLDALKPRSFTTMASRQIREISSSEIKHKMHQVISW